MTRTLNAGFAGQSRTSWFGWAAVLVTALVALTMTGCDMNANAANTYFSGQDAEAAEAIDGHDAERLEGSTKGLDLNRPGRDGMTLASIVRLNPDAIGATVTDVTLDKSGQPVAQAQTSPAPGTTPEGSERLQKFEQPRALMIRKGVKFPADSPAKVREQMARK